MQFTDLCPEADGSFNNMTVVVGTLILVADA